MTFRDEIAAVINRHSRENGSNTPDFILAQFLNGCLYVFDATMVRREKWYGRPINQISSDGESGSLITPVAP